MNTLRNYGIKNVQCLQFGRNSYQVFSPRMQLSRLYQGGSKNIKTEKEESQGFSNLSEQIPSAISSKYNIFRDEDAAVILDVEEERLKHRKFPQEQDKDEFSGLNLGRGVHGVFDIEEIVDILRREKLENIFVASLPPDINYVDYIIIVTGKSKRHMSAVAEFVRKLYKKKRYPHDLIPRIEGKNSKDWMALDLGNIALHIFSRNARSLYDLESLWSVGSEYDVAYNKPDDPLITLLQKHSVYLDGLQPAEGISENINV